MFFLSITSLLPPPFKYLKKGAKGRNHKVFSQVRDQATSDYLVPQRNPPFPPLGFYRNVDFKADFEFRIFLLPGIGPWLGGESTSSPGSGPSSFFTLKLLLPLGGYLCA